jgi:hypothetical protein
VGKLGLDYLFLAFPLAAKSTESLHQEYYQHLNRYLIDRYLCIAYPRIFWLLQNDSQFFLTFYFPFLLGIETFSWLVLPQELIPCSLSTLKASPPLGWLLQRIQKSTNVGRDMEKAELLGNVGRDVKW